MNSESLCSTPVSAPAPPNATAPQQPHPLADGRGRLRVFGTLFVIGVAFLFLLTLLPTRIPTGVSIAGVAVGGKTVADATSALQQQLPAQTLTLTDGSRSWPISPG